MTRSTNTALGTEQPSLLVSSRPSCRRHSSDHVKPLTRDLSMIQVQCSRIPGILINLSLITTVRRRWEEDGAQAKNLHSPRAPHTVAALSKLSLALILRIRIQQYFPPIPLSPHPSNSRSALLLLPILPLRMAYHMVRRPVVRPSEARNSGYMAATREGTSNCLGQVSPRS